MSKCDVCKKPITKSSISVECSKWEKLVHLNNKCTGLTNKQIAALKAASCLEWTCLECQQESPKRHSTVYIPQEEDDEEEDDEEEEDRPVQTNTKLLVANITKEVDKAIKKEMKELNDSLQFHSAKLDEVVEYIETLKKNVKSLARKNVELTNKNNNLETRIGALELRIHEIEQNELKSCIEIANIPYSEKKPI